MRVQSLSARQADHQHIVGMHDHFDTPTHLYLVLDYVEGGELFDRIVDEGNFTEQDASRITRQMTEAIQYLHDRKIVHRDLKPENLLFKHRENTDCILVTDFGLAKLVQCAYATTCLLHARTPFSCVYFSLSSPDLLCLLHPFVLPMSDQSLSMLINP